MLPSCLQAGERQACAARVEAAILQQQLQQRLDELQRQLTAAQEQAEGANARAADLQRQLEHHQEQAEQHWKQLQLEVSGCHWNGAGALLQTQSSLHQLQLKVCTPSCSSMARPGSAPECIGLQPCSACTTMLACRRTQRWRWLC